MGNEWRPLRGTDWEDLLAEPLGPEFWTNLRTFLDNARSISSVFPPDEEVFAALHRTLCRDTKVVIIGQDPYLKQGQAHGLAFSVPLGTPKPQTLKNIHKELDDDGFGPIPDHGNLQAWADRGVLLLNTALTVRKGDTRSHRGAWRHFTDTVVTVVDGTRRPIFILWGDDARRTKRLLDQPRNRVIESVHPAGQSAYHGFFHSHPFSRANCMLREMHIDPIDWILPPQSQP
jgi:uracil-DNA glycosylase